MLSPKAYLKTKQNKIKKHTLYCVFCLFRGEVKRGELECLGYRTSVFHGNSPAYLVVSVHVWIRLTHCHKVMLSEEQEHFKINSSEQRLWAEALYFLFLWFSSFGFAPLLYFHQAFYAHVSSMVLQNPEDLPPQTRSLAGELGKLYQGETAPKWYFSN